MIKKLLLFLVLCVPTFAFAQSVSGGVNNPLWKLSSNTLSPVVSTWAINVSGCTGCAGGATSTNPEMASYFVATSTTATSTFLGGLAIGTQNAIVSPFTVEAGVNQTMGFLGGSVNNWTQLNIQNRSTGNNASSLYSTTADVGSSATYYTEFGINNSGYQQAGFNSQNPLDSFLTSSDGAFVIGSASSTNALSEIRFVTGGTASSSIRMEIKKSGNVGIGTTSPYALLSVQSGASTGDAFAIATTTAKAVWGVDNDGHQWTSGPAPAVSSCGTGTGTVVGDDQSGTVTTATAATSCTLTFSKVYRFTPICNVTDNSLVGFADVASLSTSAVTFGISSALTGGLLYYNCKYHQ